MIFWPRSLYTCRDSSGPLGVLGANASDVLGDGNDLLGWSIT